MEHDLTKRHKKFHQTKSAGVPTKKTWQQEMGTKKMQRKREKDKESRKDRKIRNEKYTDGKNRFSWFHFSDLYILIDRKISSAT